MEERPLSLTIIAWIIIVSGLFALYSALTIQNNPVAARMLAQSPLPASAHQAFAIVGCIVSLIVGYGILKGYPWSRRLYIGWGILSLAFSLATTPIMSILIMSA